MEDMVTSSVFYTCINGTIDLRFWGSADLVTKVVVVQWKTMGITNHVRPVGA